MDAESSTIGLRMMFQIAHQNGCARPSIGRSNGASLRRRHHRHTRLEGRDEV